MADNNVRTNLEINVAPAEATMRKWRKTQESNPMSVSLGKFNTDFTKFEQSLDAATARVVAFTATTSLIYGVGNAFQRLVSDAIKIESVMVRIQSVFGSTTKQTEEFQKSIFDLANATGVTFYEAADAAEEFSRQGLSLTKTLEATSAALVITKLSGTSTKAAIEGLTAILSTFNEEALDYAKVADKLSALDAAFATSAGGLTEGLKRVAGVAAEAGLSFDQTAAALTSLKQVTGRSEAVLGNSLKSIFTTLQTDKIQKELGSLGVETRDASGEFRNLTEVLSDLSKVYSTLDDAQRSLIAQKIGKTYQANAFQGILKTFETGDYEKALKTSQNAGGDAASRIDQINKTTESALIRFSNNITKLGGNLGDQLGKPILEKVVGYFNTIIEKGNEIFGGKDNKLGNALISGLSAALSGPGVLLLGFGLTKLLARIVKESGQALQAVVGLSGKKESIAQIDRYISEKVLPNLNEQELKRLESLTSIEAKQKAILDLMAKQASLANAQATALSSNAKVFGINKLDVATARKYAKKIPKTNASGYLPEEISALSREKLDIMKGVGGARPTAKPMLKTLNIGNGKPEKVVVNSDEKIIPNFAGSGQHAIINREMMGFASGRLPNFAKGKEPVYLFDAYREKNGQDDNGPAEPKRARKFNKKGFVLVDYSNIESIMDENRRKGVTPRLIDPTNSILTQGIDVKGAFSLTAPQSPNFYKYGEASRGGLQESIKLSDIPGFAGYGSNKAINQVIEYGRSKFGSDNFFLKSDTGAQGSDVFTPGSLYFKNLKGDRRTYLPRGYKKGEHELFLQKGIPNSTKREFRVHAAKIGDKAQTFGKTALKSTEFHDYKGFATMLKEEGPGPAIGTFLSKKIAEKQLQRALTNFKDPQVAQSISGADILETGNRGLQKVLQLVGEYTGLKIGKPGGGIIEYNFSQVPGELGGGGASGAFSRLDSIVGGGKALLKSSKVSTKEFVKRGKIVQKLSGQEQAAKFKSLYVDLLKYKKYDEAGYLATVKKLGGVGFGVTAGRGRAKRFISPKSLARGHIPIQHAFNRESSDIARGIGGAPPTAKPYLTNVNGGLAVVNTSESISRSPSGDSVVPNFSVGTPTGPSRKERVDAYYTRLKKIEDNILRNKGSLGKLSETGQNFYSSVKDSRKNPEVAQAINDRKERVEKSRQKYNGFNIGFAASFAGGAISEFAKGKNGEETTTSKNISTVSNAVGVGALAASFGKIPGVIGGVIAAVGAFNTLAGDDTTPVVQKYAKSLESLTEKYQQQEEAITNYRTNFESLSEAIATGSEKNIAVAQDMIAKTLASVKDPGLRKQLAGATSSEDVGRITSEIENQKRVELARAQINLKSSEAIKATDAGGLEKLGNFFNEGIKYGFSTENYKGNRKQFSKDEISSYGSLFSQDINLEKLSQSDKERIQNEGLSDSDFSSEAQARLGELSKVYGNTASVMIEASREVIKSLESEGDAAIAVQKIVKAQNFEKLFSGATQKGNFGAFSKNIGDLQKIDSVKLNLESNRSYLSESAGASGDYSIKLAENTADLNKEIQDLNESLSTSTLGLLKGKSFTPEKGESIANALKTFGESGNRGDFLKSMKDLLGTDFKELEKVAVDQYGAMQKLVYESELSRKQMGDNFKSLIQKIQESQRSKIYGGGNILQPIGESVSIARKGLAARLSGPNYNKFENPEKPGTGRDIAGRPLFTSQRYGQEVARSRTAEADRGRKIIAGALASKDAGLEGIDLSPDAPKALVEARKKLIDRRRADFAKAQEAVLKGNQAEYVSSQSAGYIDSLQESSKKKTGVPIFQGNRKDIESAISRGDYGTAIKAAESAKSGATPIDSAKLDEFINFLKDEQGNVKNIPQAAIEAAKAAFPDMSVQGKMADSLNTLNGIQKNAEASLSSIEGLLKAADQKVKTDVATDSINSLISDKVKTTGELFAIKNQPLATSADGSPIYSAEQQKNIFEKTKKLAEINSSLTKEMNPITSGFAGGLKTAFGGLTGNKTPNYVSAPNKPFSVFNLDTPQMPGVQVPFQRSDMENIKYDKIADKAKMDSEFEAFRKSKIEEQNKLREEKRQDKLKGTRQDPEYQKLIDAQVNRTRNPSIESVVNVSISGGIDTKSFREELQQSFNAIATKHFKDGWKENTGKPAVAKP